jgi:hypothetical protein
MAKVTWNDLNEGHQSELKKTYKLNDRQFEQQVRRHMDGANTGERRKFYEDVFGKKK